jgi:hypothetical protein
MRGDLLDILCRCLALINGSEMQQISIPTGGRRTWRIKMGGESRSLATEAWGFEVTQRMDLAYALFVRLLRIQGRAEVWKGLSFDDGRTRDESVKISTMSTAGFRAGRVWYRHV